ncbi:Bug family tripartite tricarboxylate transporter substrate binding protein [Noviherbaspirillum aerium]|uniref:Bug family tripartite tricarboxylate transporter substrate binding protein n=1 Tax=Noviherbaspirillum aerium TaxID=2588497 RepID=UPI00124EB3AB|nr:tripartite tricarboxylate transporter substrate binding protein [Noviherbaspirillum aerium]
MNSISSRRRAVAAILALSAALPFPSFAQGDKTVRMIVPNAPGSSVDALSRTVGDKLARAAGGNIVIENLPGAGGVPGTAQLTRAAKDGLTLGMVSNNHVVNPSLYKKIPYDAIKDITPITVVAGSPFVLVAHPSVQARDLKELVALAKANNGELTIGSSGNGTILHLAAEALQSEAGIKLRHVPYKGTGQLTTDLLGGQIQLAFLGVTGAAQHVKAGKLNAIGVSTATPSPLLPNALPLAQQGLTNFNLQGWIALIGPGGLPAPMVSKLYNDTKALLGTKEVQDALTAQGFTPMGTAPDATAALFQNELTRYAKLIKQSGMTID